MTKNNIAHILNYHECDDQRAYQSLRSPHSPSEHNFHYATALTPTLLGHHTTNYHAFNKTSCQPAASPAAYVYQLTCCVCIPDYKKQPDTSCEKQANMTTLLFTCFTNGRISKKQRPESRLSCSAPCNQLHFCR